MRKFFQFILGVITGAFLGSALVILLTPYSGSDLLKQVFSRLSALSDEIQQASTAKRLEMENELANLRKNIPLD